MEIHEGGGEAPKHGLVDPMEAGLAEAAIEKAKRKAKTQSDGQIPIPQGGSDQGTAC